MIVSINGMSCQHCVMAVKKALESVSGLTDLKVEIGKAEFNCDSCDREVIRSAIEDQGYEVTSID